MWMTLCALAFLFVSPFTMESEVSIFHMHTAIFRISFHSVLPIVIEESQNLRVGRSNSCVIFEDRLGLSLAEGSEAN
jgi:hypothetical protein